MAEWGGVDTSKLHGIPSNPHEFHSGFFGTKKPKKQGDKFLSKITDSHVVFINKLLNYMKWLILYGKLVPISSMDGIYAIPLFNGIFRDPQ